MPIISFYADKVAHLAQLSIDNPDHRRPSFEQRYSMAMLRDDLSAERRADLEAKAEDGFCFEIKNDDLDLKKIPAGVWVVGDAGIYIMSNISMQTPGLVTTPIEHAVQSHETDVRNVGPDGQWEAKCDIFGGDDGVIFIDAEFILAASHAAKAEKKNVLMLEMTEDMVGMVSPEQGNAYFAMMKSDDPLFFDPDQKAPPQKLWASPEAPEAKPNP